MTFSGVKIAVCGHRSLDAPHHLETSILAASSRIQEVYQGLPYQVFSCLAEGSDRLLAYKLIHTLPADLIVILPLPEQEYLKDFQTKESIQEFCDLKRMAKKVVTLDQEYIRPTAYQEANRYLMENCDLLVTIWDGLPARGPGGTAELVQLARINEWPLIWIHPNQTKIVGSLTEERLKSLS